MADFTVARSKHATLGAGAADRVSFHTRHYVVTVSNLGTDPVYVTFDGSDPVVGGEDTAVVLGGKSREFGLIGRGIREVGVISVGAGDYNVEATL